MPKAAISVCICTYRRQPQLVALLRDLALQTRLPQQVVVVDNEAPGTARDAVQALIPELPYALDYSVQPEKNIALTRNQSVARASGEWLAFLDDDQRVGPGWLASYENCTRQHAADGAMGRVNYCLPPEAPGWMQRGDFHARRKRHASGTRLGAESMGIGNAFLRAAPVRAQPGPFNAQFGLTGGEDSDFMARLADTGAKLVWCDEAVADEWVDANRLNLRWLLLRALRGGQDYAHRSLAGESAVLGKAQLFADAAAKAGLAAVVAGPAALTGAHRGVFWLQKCAANVGKLSAFAGLHYREYG